MRRGIIRIISGVVLIALQLLFLDGPSYSSANARFNIGYYIGYYLPAIGGVFLLIFGGRACYRGVYSKLVLHDNNKKIHTVMKWCGFALSTFLFLCNLLAFIASWDEIDVLAILNILGFLSFSVYTLFYMYKKPSCLFSAALIFVGVAYIYGICRNIAYYVLYLPDEEYFVSYVFTDCDMRFYGAAFWNDDLETNGYVTGPHFSNEGVNGMKVTHWMETQKLPEPPRVQGVPNGTDYV